MSIKRVQTARKKRTNIYYGDRAMQTTVRIMMATYNGEKYIREQIESIIGQTYNNWSLIIQDDGSTDNTWNILEQYCDSRITIRRSPEKKHGAYCNFHSIANQEKQNGETYEYYMFCDQDDVWDTDKIEKMLKVVREVERHGEKNDMKSAESIDAISATKAVVFCYADMRVIDEQGIEQIESICTLQGLKYVNKESLFFSHVVYGCNTLMNSAAFFSVPVIDINQEWVSFLSHDNLYAKFSGMLGKVIYFPETTMGYRRHGGNVTSTQAYGFGVKRIIKRMVGIHDLARDHARTYNQSLIAIKLLEAQGYSRRELADISKPIKIGGVSALTTLRKKKVSWGNITKDISHKLIIFLKIYKKYMTV